VLSFQPQVANIEASMIRQKIELAAAESTLKSVTIQLERLNSLQSKLNSAVSAESTQLLDTSKMISNVLVNKRQNIADTQQVITDAKFLLAQVDQELKVGLITKDQAAQRRIALQSAMNNATDAKSQEILLQHQSKQLSSGAGTLLGQATSLSALSSVKLNAELQAMSDQLTIQLVTLKSTIAGLGTTIAEGTRILDVAKTTPYYRALRGEVNVAFVPYGSFKRIHVGDPIYDCVLTILICSKVGEITAMYDAEEYARHPFIRNDLRGRLVEIAYTNKESANSQVVFVGHSPLIF
jgi:hypothetical protein